MNVIPFKPKYPQPPKSMLDQSVGTVEQIIKQEVANLKTGAEKGTFLLTLLATISYQIFDLNLYQDPRVNLCNGIKELYVRWCRGGH